MGCAVSNPEARKYLRVPTLCGQLKITILNCHLQRSTNTVMTMDPYVKIIISNQIQKTDIRKKGGFDPRFDHDCSFFINSCYKPYGRSLQIFVMDQNLIASDKVIGYGLMDLDPIIKKNDTLHDIKVRLNYECGQVGIANLKMQFIQQPYETLSFRFQTIDITKRTNIVGVMNCWVRLTIGEEVMETQRSKDAPEGAPSWIDEVFVMLVPKCVPVAVVEVFDDKKLIGKGEFSIQKFKEIQQQQLFKEIVREGDGNGSAILAFSVIKGENGQFQTDKRSYSKIVTHSELKKVQVIKQQDVKPVLKEQKIDKYKQQKAEQKQQKAEQKPTEKQQQKPQHKPEQKIQVPKTENIGTVQANVTS